MPRLSRAALVVGVTAALLVPASGAIASDANDELLFYREDGLYRYYDVSGTGALGTSFLGGSDYTRGWDIITALDLDGDGQDELLFYRDDGVYAFYNVRSDGLFGGKINGGTNFTRGWDSIAAVDLDGDGKDELLFYRDDGLYAFYDVTTTGRTSTKIRGGTNYTRGWDSISGLDLDGDRKDELLFYRDDGLYAFFDATTTGRTSTKIRGGTNYTRGWDSITAVDLDADIKDELLFYRDDGLYAFFDVTTTGGTSTKIRGGTNYTTGWDVIAAVDVDQGQPARPVTFGDGTWDPGGNLPAGTYRTQTLSFPNGCYWERASTSGEVLSNSWTFESQIVTMPASDGHFLADGCGTWTANLDVPSRGPTTNIPPGMFTVNTDIKPGRWQSAGGVYCFWQRLSGFRGDTEEILASGLATEGAIVTIASTDRGFSTNGCAPWVYLGP